MNTRRIAAVALACLAGLASGSVAQQQPAKGDQPPLQGPKVNPSKPAMLEEGFTNVRRPGKDGGPAGGAGLQLRAYMQAINKLRGDEAPADVRLSDEQDKKIRAIQDDFQAKMRAYMQEAREKMQQEGMSPEDGAPARDGQKPEGKGGDGEKREKARQRMEEVRKNGPQPSEAQAKVWAVLNEPQQKFVQGEVEKIKQDMEKRQGEERVRRDIQKRKGGEDGKPGAQGAGESGAPDPAARERVQRVLQRLRDLPPDQREQILRKLEADLDRVQGDRAEPGQTPPKRPAGDKPGKGGQRRGKPGDEAKPAPGVDGVNVPPPDKK